MYNPNLLTARNTVCETAENFRDVFEALFELRQDLRPNLLNDDYTRNEEVFQQYDAIDEMLDKYFEVTKNLTALRVLLSDRLYLEAKKEITK